MRKIKIILFAIIFINMNVYSQLDSIHWFPPMHSRTTGSVSDHYIYLSTPDTSAFTVTITDGAGNVLATPVISQGVPYRYYIGNGIGTKAIIAAADLNTVLLDRGLIMSASHKFYANFRVRSGTQAGSLTCKGTAARGKKFRAGVVPTNPSNNESTRSFCISVMATENNTNVTISDYDTDVEFNDVNGNILDDTITFNLDSGQCYVLSGYNSIVANRRGFVGALVESDKKIVLNNGNLTGSIVVGSSGQDNMIDQSVPIDELGNEYILIRGNGTDDMEQPLVIATEDSTEIYVNGSSSPLVTINAGDWYLIPESNYLGNNNENMYVLTSKNVYMYQPLGGTADAITPGLNFVPPLSCFYTKKVDLIPDVDSIGTTFYNGAVFAYTLAGSALTVNGVLQSGAELVSGNIAWETYKLTGLSGDVAIESEGPMAVGFFGYNGAAGFAGFYSGFSVEKEKYIEHHANDSSKNCMGHIFSINDTSYIEDITWYVVSVDSSDIILGTSTDYQIDYLFPDSGTYIVSAVIQFNCYRDSIIDTIAVMPLIYNFDIVNEHCNLSDGAITVNLLSGVEPISYNWSTGDTLNYISNISNGNYQITLTDNNGCHMQNAVSVGIINSEINIIAVDTEFCEGGSTVLIADSGFVSYNWIQTGETTQNINVSTSGFYTVIATDSAGCPASDSIEIIVNPNPYVYAGDDEILCSNEDVILSAINPDNAQIQWSNGITDGVSFIQPVGTQTYTVTATLNSCQSLDSIVITVNPTPLFTATYSDFCAGGSTTLSVNELYDSYQWMYQGNIISTNQDVNVSQQGVYYVFVTQDNCTSYDSVLINEIDATLVNVVSIDSAKCFNENSGAFSVNLLYQGIDYDVYIYNLTDTLHSQNSLNENISINLDSLYQGLYIVETVNNNGCILKDSIEIKAPSQIETYADIADVLCNGEKDGSISVEITGGTPNYQILWSNQETGESISNLLAGNYSVTINDKNDCVLIQEYNISEPPPINIYDSVYYNNLGNIDIEVSGGVGYFEYQWSNGETSQDIYNLEPGEYYLTVYDANMCSVVNKYEIEYVEGETELKIPTVITPNADGINDTWQILGIEEYNNISIQIYNRWGDILFEFAGTGYEYADVSKQWDGTWKGKDLPFGTYLYILDLHQNKSHTGTITIVR